MRSDIEGVIHGFNSAILVSDVAAAMAYCHDDIRVTLHFHDYALPFVGNSVGIATARRRMEQTFAAWSYLDSRPLVVSIEDNVARVTVPTVLQHKTTRAIVECTFRHLYTFTDGRIIGFDSYVDIAYLKSFYRMIGLPAGPPRAA